MICCTCLQGEEAIRARAQGNVYGYQAVRSWPPDAVPHA